MLKTINSRENFLQNSRIMNYTKKAVKQIKNRPELGPHFIYNMKSQFELDDQRETLGIISKINFQ